MTEVSTLDALHGYGSLSYYSFFFLYEFYLALLAILIPACIYFIFGFNPKFY